MAFALAVDSCCDTTMAARPANPSGRRRSGGRPAAASASRQRGSAATSPAMAAVEIGFGVEVERHARSIYNWTVGATVFWKRAGRRSISEKWPPVFR